MIPERNLTLGIKMTRQQVETIICDWSTETQHTFTEKELDSLVCALATDKEPVCEMLQNTLN